MYFVKKGRNSTKILYCDDNYNSIVSVKQGESCLCVYQTEKETQASSGNLPFIGIIYNFKIVEIQTALAL